MSLGVPFYNRKGEIVAPPERFVDQDADVVFDPATLPENRALIKMLDELEAQESGDEGADDGNHGSNDEGAPGASGDTGGS